MAATSAISATLTNLVQGRSPLSSAPIGATLAGLAANAAGPTFELQFSQLQNTIIRRVNKEIARINASGAADHHRVEQLQHDGLKLADSLPLLEAYRQGNVNNIGQLESLSDEATALTASLGTDNVDQTEVDAFTAQRDLVVQRLNDIFIFVHPDIVDGNVIQNLKKQVDTLNALTPVVGTQADNQAVFDALATFQNQVDVALTVTENTVEVTAQLEENVQKQQTEILAQFEELTTAEQARKATEVDNLKADFANLLTAISLSFEANKDFPAALNSFLTPFRPAPGSILNLFT